MTAAPPSDGSRAMLRHLVATLAYRAAKTVRGAPAGFGEFSARPTARTPAQIMAHMGDLIAWGIKMVEGEYLWRPGGGAEWDANVERFFAELATLDRLLASEAPLGFPAETLIQGPLADALTHVGQLAMLRGAAGAPVRPESYAKAEIVAGRVGLDQAPPGKEFDGDASARRPR